jgi:hypothetical protein
MVGFYKFFIVALGVVSAATASLIDIDLDLNFSNGKEGCSPHHEDTRKEWFVLARHLNVNWVD